ncbi:MAG: LLM class oxidoreductase [Pseudomonadota bacterium]
MTAQPLNTSQAAFAPLNTAYRTVFAPDRLSIGLVVPIESYPDRPTPTMTDHIKRVQLAESLGFAAVWLRDVPFDVPSFGDAGQIFDPFVYLGSLASQTKRIALGVASIILPLRHPVHTAKAAATVDTLSDGRLLLGIASGDRPEEYPAFDTDYHSRGERFRSAYDYLRALSTPRPQVANDWGTVGGGIDLLPKPVADRLPLLVTGGSQQSPEWLATHADGWMTYPRPAPTQARLISNYRSAIARAGLTDKPVMEPLYVDLVDDPLAPPQPIHLGLRLGVNALRNYLMSRQAIGVNHIALNLRFNQADIETTLQTIAADLLPHFDHKERS